MDLSNEILIDETLSNMTNLELKDQEVALLNNQVERLTEQRDILEKWIEKQKTFYKKNLNNGNSLLVNPKTGETVDEMFNGVYISFLEFKIGQMKLEKFAYREEINERSESNLNEENEKLQLQIYQLRKENKDLVKKFKEDYKSKTKKYKDEIKILLGKLKKIDSPVTPITPSPIPMNFTPIKTPTLEFKKPNSIPKKRKRGSNLAEKRKKKKRKLENSPFLSSDVLKTKNILSITKRSQTPRLKRNINTTYSKY